VDVLVQNLKGKSTAPGRGNSTTKAEPCEVMLRMPRGVTIATEGTTYT